MMRTNRIELLIVGFAGVVTVATLAVVAWLMTGAA